MATSYLCEVFALTRTAASAELNGNPEAAAKSYRKAAHWMTKVIAETRVKEARDAYICQQRHFLGKAELLFPCSELTESESSAEDPSSREFLSQQTPINTEDSRLTTAILDTIRPRPLVKFKDIIGQEVAKKIFRDHVLQPYVHKSMYLHVKKRFTSFMLFGSPGTGKSMIANAVAGESSVHTFFHVSSSVLISKWQGESAKLIARLFEKAMEMKPSIVFIDEIDSLALNRSSDSSESSRRIKTELFIRLEDATNNVGDGVTLIVACNRPWELDSAFLQRFECFCNITLPTATAISKLFARELVNPLLSDLTLEDCKRLGVMCHGYSGRQILHICTEVIMTPVTRFGDSTHFLAVRRSGETQYRPSHQSTPNAVRMNVMSIPADNIDFHHYVYRDDVFSAVRNAGRMEDHVLQYRLEKFNNEMTGNCILPIYEEPKNPVMWLYMCLCD